MVKIPSRKKKFFDFGYFFDEIGVSPDSTALDLGCSSGFFTINLAQDLDQGRVFALDRDSTALEYLRFHSANMGLGNIVILEQDILKEDLKIPASSLDLVLANNFLSIFDQDELDILLVKLYKTIKEGGKLVITSWGKKVRTEEFLKNIQGKMKNAKGRLNLEKVFFPSDYILATVWEKR